MTYKYFSGLKYTLSNEDTSLEMALVKKYSPKVIVSVAGSGSRSIPLIIHGCKKLYALDINEAQLFLCELRVRSYLDLTYEEFIGFWGYPTQNILSIKRKELFTKLKLPPKVYDYFIEVFEKNRWNSILYFGSWEKTFKTFSKVAKFIMGERRLKLFECKTLKEQQTFYKSDFPKVGWHLVLKILGNKAVFNALLYKGSFVKKNINESYFQFYKKRFDHLFKETLARENFFLQLCLFGEIKFNEALLVEAKFENFTLIKDTLKNSPCSFVLNSCIDFLENYPEKDKVDFVSLSDVPSYFDDKLINSYLQKIKPSLAEDAIVVIRYYLRVPPKPKLTGFKDITYQFSQEIYAEKVGVYTIVVLQKIKE